MNLPATHIERIKDLGYTDSEAHFLYIVAVFSGYFTLGHFRYYWVAASFSDSKERKMHESPGWAEPLCPNTF